MRLTDDVTYYYGYEVQTVPDSRCAFMSGWRWNSGIGDSEVRGDFSLAVNNSTKTITSF